MKGKLVKRDNNWYVTHIMDDNGVQFGVDYPINPALEKYYFLDEDAEGGEVEFEIITIDNGDNGVRYAKLKRSEYPELEGTMNLCNDVIKRTGKMTEEEWQAAERAQAKEEQKGILVELMELDSKDGLYESVTISSPQYIPEISDEMIKEVGLRYCSSIEQQIGWYKAIEWYREQLKKKQ